MLRMNHYSVSDEEMIGNKKFNFNGLYYRQHIVP